MDSCVFVISLLLVVPSIAFAQSSSRPANFADDVQPILAKYCSDCHHPGGPAPFGVQTYDDVAPHARAIADAVSRRAMPPWKPEPGYGGPFLNERHLSAEAIATLERWADAGAPPGNLAHTPVDAAHDHGGWQLGTPDLVVTLPKPFVLRAGRQDVFRNFALPLPLDTVRYVKGIEFRPANHRVTHHANMRIDPTSASSLLDAHEPEPGYGGIAAPTAVFPDGHFLGWTPGQAAPFLPDGLAWTITPGSSLVVETHLVPTREDETVNFEVGLYFTSVPPELDKTPVMMRLGRQNIDIRANEFDYVIRDEFRLPVDVDVLSVQPHAHYLAREIKAVAELPDGSVKWLIYIKSWDFHEQDHYRYQTPVSLPRGTYLRMEYTYDNSARNLHNPTSPPVRVRWGQNTRDEMGDLHVQVLPRNHTERLGLTESIRAKELAEDMVGYRMLLDRDPGNAWLHATIAAGYGQMGRWSQALDHLRTAVRLDPMSAVAHRNLATGLAAANKHLDALKEYGRSLELDPGDPIAYDGLGSAFLQGNNDVPLALVAFQEAIRLDSHFANAHNNLGVALERQNRLDEALAAYTRAADLLPSGADPRYNAGRVLEKLGRYEEALRYYRETRMLQPNDQGVQRRLAWVLSTAPDRSVDEHREALSIAEGLLHALRNDPEALETLAAAQAANDDLRRAIGSARTAVTLYDERGQKAQAAAATVRLDTYRRAESARRP